MSEGRVRRLLLLASVFVVAAAGLVYELIAGTLSTYLLGSSVTVFSVVIGLFLSAMGLGAWLAQYVREQLLRAFVVAELALGLAGGLSALLLFVAYTFSDSYLLVLLAVSVGVGALVGIEIPLLMRILAEGGVLAGESEETSSEDAPKADPGESDGVRIAVSHVLALDYLGALLGSLLFPLLLLPHLGLVRSGALLGLMNVAVGALALRMLGGEVRGRGALWLAAAGASAVLGLTLVTGGRATTWLEDRLYSDPVLVARSTSYQRMVVTRWRDDTRLFLDGHLQFSTTDEYRYHEALVHPAMAAVPGARRVLVLGGGDGMGVREVLRWPDAKRITLVDLDPAVTELFRERPDLAALNAGSLDDPRVEVVAMDAVRYLDETEERFDVILMDLPDPNDAQLARLYSLPTMRLVRRRLKPGGAFATQATSPYYAREAFWCIVATVERAFGEGRVELAEAQVVPYHAHVPTFGEWGWVLAAPDGMPKLPDELEGLRFLDDEALEAMVRFPVDLRRPEGLEVNRLGDPVLARYYVKGWKRWN